MFVGFYIFVSMQYFQCIGIYKIFNNFYTEEVGPRSGRQRPYWIRRNVSNGYYRPRSNRGRGRGRRGNNRNRRRSRESSEEEGGRQGPNQRRVEGNAPRQNEGAGAATPPENRNLQESGNGTGV